MMLDPALRLSLIASILPSQAMSQTERFQQQYIEAECIQLHRKLVLANLLQILRDMTWQSWGVARVPQDSGFLFSLQVL